jgi:hypothetical protein
LTTKGSKLVAILLIAVVAAGAGYWLLTPRIPNEATSMVEHTSILTPLQSSQTSTESTIQTSPTAVASTSTVAITETTLWINITAAKPVNYYLALLESNGTEPYVQLATELRKLPDLTNATAVAKITYLALNATNPEVKEAFQLMIKGGTPSQSDFSYTVPSYNTELQVLYWLACQNEFKKDDTLALAIAMVNGLWVTMGDEQVSQAVYNDTSQLLRFFRETNELQQQRGYWQLEDYPLEAKLCLAWTGNIALARDYNGADLGVPKFRNQRYPIEAYEWVAVSPQTLRDMRREALSSVDRLGSPIAKVDWSSKDTGDSIRKLEEYFIFSGKQYTHLETDDPAYLALIRNPIDGILVESDQVRGVNWQFYERYMKGQKWVGDCTAAAAWLDGWAKSMGIATDFWWRGAWVKDFQDNVVWRPHGDILFYDPPEHKWYAYPEHFNPLNPFNPTFSEFETPNDKYFLHIWKMPVDQRGILNKQLENGVAESRLYGKCGGLVTYSSM